jgi:hypothetical protein
VEKGLAGRHILLSRRAQKGQGEALLKTGILLKYDEKK